LVVRELLDVFVYSVELGEVEVTFVAIYEGMTGTDYVFGLFVYLERKGDESIGHVERTQFVFGWWQDSGVKRQQIRGTHVPRMSRRSSIRNLFTIHHHFLDVNFP